MTAAVQRHVPSAYEKRVAKLLTKTLQKKTRSFLSAAVRSTSGPRIDATHALSDCFTELSGLTQPTLRQLMKTKAWHVAKSAIQSFVQRNQQQDISPLLADFVRTLCRDAAITDMRLRLPPPAKEPETTASGPPLTPVQQRARSVNERLANWQRKLKLAKTKIARLKKQQAYYRRKSVG
jgi:hypothetical protein